MFKKIAVVVLLLMVICSPAFAIKFSVDSTRIGQGADINVTRAGDSSVSGHGITIDLSKFDQSSTSGAVEVLELDQADVDQPFLKFTCTEGALNCNSSYTSTNSTKAGSVLININGTNRWIQFFDDPN